MERIYGGDKEQNEKAARVMGRAEGERSHSGGQLKPGAFAWPMAFPRLASFCPVTVLHMKRQGGDRMTF